MPHHKSAKKRVRQTEVRTARNKSQSSETKTILKSIRAAISSNKKEEALSMLPIIQKLFAKLSKKGIIKSESAARRTSRLASQVSKL